MKTSAKRLIEAERAACDQATIFRNRVEGGTTDEVHGSIERDLGGQHGRDHPHAGGALKNRLIELAGRIALAYTEAAVVTAAQWTQRAKPDLKRRDPRVERLIALRDTIQRQIDNELQMKDYCGLGGTIFLYERDGGDTHVTGRRSRT
jgi:hypothetical protein